MTFQRNIMTDYKKYKEPSKIYLGDDRIVEAYGEGNFKLKCHDSAETITLNLHKVLFVPEIKKKYYLFQKLRRITISPSNDPDAS